jgi:hypothetical protein
MTVPNAAILRAVFVTFVTLLPSACLVGIIDLAEDEDVRGVEISEPFLQVVEVGRQRAIRVEGINGTIHVEGSPDLDRVTIDAVRRVRSDSRHDAEEYLDYLHIFVWNDPEELLIQTVQPDPAGQRDFEVDYRIAVPEHLRVEIFNANGSVRVENVTTDVWVEDMNGDVFLRGVRGNAWVDLANGVVDTEIVIPEGGELVHVVGNGGARVRVQEEVSAELSARVGNGTIDIGGLELTNRASNGTSVTALLGQGQGLIDVAVGNGWIQVRGR